MRDALYFGFGVIAIMRNWFSYALFFFGVDRSPTFLVHLRNGLHFYIRRGGGDMISLFEDYYERQYVPCDALVPKQPRIILDIGAHIGTVSLLMDSVTRGKTMIYSYEPVSANYALLLRNIDKNQARSVQPRNYAVWKSSKRQRIFFAGDSFLGSSLTSKTSRRYETVSCVTLQQIFDREHIRHADLVKIDVEGAEYEILFSSPPSLFKRIEALYVEFHAVGGSLPDRERELVTFFRKHGYFVYLYSKRPILYAVRKKLSLKGPSAGRTPVTLVP